MKMDISSFKMQEADDAFFKDNCKSQTIKQIDSVITVKKKEMGVIAEDVFRRYEAYFYKDFSLFLTTTVLKMHLFRSRSIGM